MTRPPSRHGFEGLPQLAVAAVAIVVTIALAIVVLP
jgi:hypothetical protein